MKTITVEELLHLSCTGAVIDMRSRKEFDKGTFPGAIHMDISQIRENRERLPKDCPLFFLCYTGDESDELVCELEEEGIHAYSVEGGFREYLRYRLKETMGERTSSEKAAKGERTLPEKGTKRKRISRSREATPERIFPNDDALVFTDSSAATPDGIGYSSAAPSYITRCRQAERSIIKKFRRELWCRFTKAIKEYDLIQDGDRIAVCISGGKDSMLMAKLFQELYRHGKRNFELVFLVMNPGYNEQNYQRILDNARLLDVPVTVFRSEIFNIVEPETSPCYLCARMRRGYLYSHAKELGCNKIALGHHYDDVIETILMGMLYGGQMQTMMPKLHSNNFEGMELIRPMYLIREKDIIRWADYNDLHFIQCACRFTENCASCGGTEKGSKRAEVKQLIAVLAERDPEVESNIFRSAENVNLNTVISWKQDGVKHHFLDGYETGRAMESCAKPRKEHGNEDEKIEHGNEEETIKRIDRR
ncbi:MAG: ATPase [Lachnospiraceae bacterium]|nr:ATPase [Lachnospiraceae bacterium]